MPGIIGTGSEDYYLGAWCYGGCGINPFGGTRPTFAYARYGNPMNGGDDRGAKWMVYRFHSDSPIAFQQNIKVTIEHGHANHRSDNFFTVAYWYQTEPHKTFPPLPLVAERIPPAVRHRRSHNGKTVATMEYGKHSDEKRNHRDSHRRRRRSRAESGDSRAHHSGAS